MRSLCSCSRLVSWSCGCSLQMAHSSVHFIMGCQAMTVIFKRRRVLARSGQSAPRRQSAVGALANYEPLSDDSLSSVVTSGARRLLGCRKPFFVFAPRVHLFKTLMGVTQPYGSMQLIDELLVLKCGQLIF